MQQRQYGPFAQCLQVMDMSHVCRLQTTTADGEPKSTLHVQRRGLLTAAAVHVRTLALELNVRASLSDSCSVSRVAPPPGAAAAAAGAALLLSSKLSAGLPSLLWSFCSASDAPSRLEEAPCKSADGSQAIDDVSVTTICWQHAYQAHGFITYNWTKRSLCVTQ